MLRARIIKSFVIISLTVFPGLTYTQDSSEGYLRATKNEVMFIQLAQLRGRVSGQMQVVSLEGRNNTHTKAQSVSFSGVVSGSQVSVVFRGFLTERTILGNLSRSKLTLSLPQANGRIATVVFARASVRQYNTAITLLEKEAANVNRETQQRNYEKQINNNIQVAFDQLAEQTSQLRQRTNFDPELNSFREHWEQMQQHAVEFGNTPSSRYLLSNVTFDASNIRYDRRSLGFETKSVQDQINNVEQAIAKLRKAWADLQSAILRDQRGAIRRDVDEYLVVQFEKNAVSETRRVQQLVRNSDEDAAKIEKKAADLLESCVESYNSARKKAP